MPIVDLDDYTPAQAREHWGYQLAQYTPPADSVIIDIDVDFVTRPITPPIHLVQYDKVLPVLAIHMYSNRSAYSMPQQSTAAIRVNNGNGTYYYAFAEGRSADFTTVYFQIQAALCLDPGFKPGVIEISNSDGLVNSSSVQIEVEQNPLPEDAVISSDDYINLRQLIDEVEKWAYGECQHLTNNSWVVKGCKDGVQIGTGATAEGAENSSTGGYSHTEGYNNTASGAYAHAEGNNSTASALAAHAEGSSSATAGNAHAEGGGTTASGNCAHSEGNASIASGGYSHAEGNGTTASGSKAHAEGDTTVASEPSAHAEGIHSEASNSAAHAEGNYTTASGESSHSEGDHTTASGNYSHAEGGSNTASGNYSHAEGGSNTASGNYSHASGYNTIAGYQAQFACGEFNENSQGNIFEVGNGADGSNRHNAFWVQRNGIVYLGLNSLNSDSIMTLMRYTNPIILPPRVREAPTVDAYHSKGKIDLTTSSEITPGNDGIMTGTLTGVCPDTIYEQCYHSRAIEYGKRFPKHVLNNYMPFFNTVFIKNTDTGTYRKVLEVGTTYAITNYDSSANTFDLTVSTRVINLSDTTPIASNVVIRKEIWAMCYPDMN